jgi:cyclopropane fatty-acyl-phospholipid synthase-like methyltransferase
MRTSESIEQRKRLNSDEALNLQLQRTWKSLRPRDWHDAVYNPGRGTFFAELVDQTVAYLEARAREIESETGRAVVFVEVGCGTGAVSARLASAMPENHVLGIDINEDFVGFALENVRKEDAKGRLDFKHGDCQRLLEIVDELMDGLKEPHVVLTFSVNNTHGVLPEDVERSINVQIEKTIQKYRGAFVVGLWNAAHFGAALQHFYLQNPDLCGELNDGDAIIDWEDTRMITSAGYRTKWFTKTEVANKLQSNEWDVVDVREEGVGILACVKPKEIVQSNDSSASRTDEYYYDTEDAFNFYMHLWGGQNIHVGIYPQASDGPETPAKILKASDASLDKLLELAAPALSSSHAKCVDMGSCYGGCAREIARRFGAEVLCADLSTKSNEVNRQRTMECGLEHLVKCPKDLSFTNTEAEAETYDCVVSQDSFLHAGSARRDVMKEAARVLKPGGLMVFTDIMQTDGVDTRKLDGVYKRLALEDMGSPAKYIQWGAEHGLRFKSYADMTEQLVNHYGTVRTVLEQNYREGTLKGKVSDAYVLNMLEGLQHWVSHGASRNICWGYVVFEKA